MADRPPAEAPAAIAPELLNHPRIVFTPHIGSAVAEVRRDIEMRAAESILQPLGGEQPAGAISYASIRARQPLARRSYQKRRHMHVAIVSDVHGNLTAFEAVLADIRRRAPDLVLHGGDLALMGPQPAEVIDRVRELGWPGVVGNTDEVLWRPQEQRRQEGLAPKLAALLSLIFQEYSPATLELLGEERVAWLRALPAKQRVEDVVLVHAAPDDLWRAPAPDADDDELSAVYAPLDAPIAVYGHIHRPYTRALRRLTVANSGSVGMPWDGDPRASYLLIEDGHLQVVRVRYDIDREVALLQTSGYPDAPRLAEMRRRGVFVKPDGAPQR